MAIQTGDKLLRLPALLECVSLSRGTIYRMMDEDRFPRPIRIGLSAVAWRQSDIDEWIDSLPKTERKDIWFAKKEQNDGEIA